jgi:site-specific DNA-methyltransferase (adenine-specific)/modification methylase
MKPYYDHAGITIYHGDCREFVAATMACVTDPPYGIGYMHGEGGGCLAKSTIFADIPIANDDAPFDPAFLLWMQGTLILWGANHYASKLPNSSCWLVWDKRDGMCTNDQADCEMAWTNLESPARLKRHYWNGMLKASERDEPRVHPTQKPVEIMKWCIGFTDPEETIYDPFMGSGTTLRAAKDLGRRAIGIEIEEKYCEIAAKRLSQEVFQF